MKIPSDMLPVMLSTGVGVGLLGVVSGVCFLVYNGYAWTRRVKQGEEIRQKGKGGICSSCENSSEGTCASCSLPVCDECSYRDQGQRKCQACCNDRLYFTNELESTGFLKLLKETLTSYNSADSLYRGRATSRTIGASKSESEIVRAKREEENRQVREFLQKLAEHLVGGSLEDVTVGKMYDHPEYIRMFRRFHGPLCSAIARLSISVRNTKNLPLTNGPAPDGSHVRLQQLVQRVIEEALRLPALLDYSGINRDNEGRLPEFSPKTYEDLLATAILNKVIDRYQNDTKKSNGASSSGVHSGSSSPGEFGRGRRRRNTKRDSSPEQSSLEPLSQDEYCHSDSSGHIGSTHRKNEDLPPLNNAYSTDEDDPHQKSFNNPVDGALSNINFKYNSRVQFPEYGGDIVEMNESVQTNMYENGKKRLSNGSKSGSGEIYANNNSWEDNWLFQKKKIKSQSVPVPMLIPNSNTEYKAMIGDRDADDTTDLSDLGSDVEETPNDIKFILLDSKSIIGGKNPEIVEMLIDDNFVVDAPEQDKCKISVTNEATNVDFKIDENGNDRSMSFYPKSNSADKNNIITEKNNKHNIQVEDYDLIKNLDSDNTDSECNLHLKSLSTVEDKFDINIITEATNLDVIDCKAENDFESLENQQQEGEYIETVDKPVQRHIDSLKRQHNIPQKPIEVEVPQQEENEPPPLPSSPMPPKIMADVDIIIDESPMTIELSQNSSSSKINSLDTKKPSYEILNRKNEEIRILDKPLECNENDFSLPHIPGSIAEREHKKWLNAVPMANNPYSPEAIQSRLEKKNQSSAFTKLPAKKSDYNETKEEHPTGVDAPENIRYGRDYYINEAKKSTGARKKKPDFKFDSQNFRRSDESDDSSYVITPISSAEITGYFESNGNDVKMANVHHAEIYSATPIIIEDSSLVLESFDDLYKKATKIEGEEQDIYILPVDLNDKSKVENLLKITNGTIITDNFEQSDSISSLDDTPRIYNVETGKIIKKIKDDLNNNTSKNSSATSQATKEIRRSNGDLYSKFNYLNDGIDAKRRGRDETSIPSVKNLARKFIREEEHRTNPSIEKTRRFTREIKDSEALFKSLSNEKSVKQPQHMHSLTARSISKEFREELKLSMPVTNVHPGGSKLSPSKTNQLVKGSVTTSSTENLQLEPGSLKNRLAYFENLAKK